MTKKYLLKASRIFAQETKVRKARRLCLALFALCFEEVKRFHDFKRSLHQDLAPKTPSLGGGFVFAK